MRLERIIPAVAASAREGLELAATRLDGSGETLLLTVAEGAAIVELGARDGLFVFAYGKLRLRPAGAAAGRAFVDAVARWLGLELEEVKAGDAEAPAVAELEGSWVRLGDGTDAFGTRWRGLKLFLALGPTRYAEVFLRLSDDGGRAQLVEKWTAYRKELVEILDRTVTGLPPRSARPRVAPAANGDGLTVEQHGEIQFEIPEGFRLAGMPEGSWRMTDADDEMTIELSSMRIPPLPPDAPGVAERLRVLVDETPHAAAAGPVSSFERGGATFAWTEYAFDSRDRKRPEAAPRPARGRTLVAANAWVQALVTGCWWEGDASIALPAWEAVIASLRLVGRIVDAPESRGRA